VKYTAEKNLRKPAPLAELTRRGTAPKGKDPYQGPGKPRFLQTCNNSGYKIIINPNIHLMTGIYAEKPLPFAIWQSLISRAMNNNFQVVW
jgi:hypothetical protein